MENYPNYNRPTIAEFISKVKEMDYLQIHKEVNSACKNIESLHGKTPDYLVRYLKELKEFGFFMYCCGRPFGVTDEHFKLYKEVAQNLIDKNQWKDSALDVFSQTSSSIV